MTQTIEELSVAECEKLLNETPIGRIGFEIAGQPIVLPVNYRWIDDSVVFRTALGKKLDAVVVDKPVAFEVDQWDPWTRRGWSVLIQGAAAEIPEWEEFEKAQDLGLFPWGGAEGQDRWVRVVPARISGRRVA